jgi:hypothetical protein
MISLVSVLPKGNFAKREMAAGKPDVLKITSL